MVRVFHRRIAALEDKVERADTTQTLSHAGLMHRRFGHLIKFETPACNSDAVKSFLQHQKTSLPVKNICWGWSDDPRMFDLAIGGSLVPNGSKLPACRSCRAWRVRTLLGSLPGVNNRLAGHQQRTKHPCRACADWQVESRTAGMLLFEAHEDYPRRCAENAPVPPPPRRPVPLPTLKSGVEDIPVMEYSPLTWTMIKMGLRYAFFNATRPLQKERWSKAKLAAYLKSCGVNQEKIDKLYELTVQVRQKGDQDDPRYYQDEEGIGSFRFPAAWLDDMEPSGHIELIMHLVFLGVAKSNFTLVSLLFKVQNADTTFRKNAQELLLFLREFRLGWLCAFPFSQKGQTTGAWVSENWVAWTRIAKIVYYWCARHDDRSKREGSDNVLRAIIAFSALVSRLMSHAGMTRPEIEEIDHYIKEFLSCIRELDVLIRHEKMKDAKNSTNGKANTNESAADSTKKVKRGSKKNKKDEAEKEDGGTKAWWTISNYISLLNLTGAILSIGPLVNWWDGGGKGERFIQQVKPLITKGVREADTFFVRILERLYKLNCIDHFRVLFDLFPKQDENSSNKSGPAEYFLAADGMLKPISELPTMADSKEIASTEEAFDNADNADFDYSPIEDQQMSKDRTIYIYRNKDALESSLKKKAPISGILIHDQPNTKQAAENDDGSLLHLYLVYRISSKKQKETNNPSPFGWFRICFDDKNGEERAGLWYAPILEDPITIENPPESYEGCTHLAKMAAVAIPLSYAGLPKGHESSSKYCVITNWWKERNKYGRFTFPSLDASLYECPDNGKLIEEQLEVLDDDGPPPPGHYII